MLRSIIAVFVVLFAPVGAAFAAEPPMPAPLQALKQDGVLVKYLGQAQGMNGWMTVKNGRIEYMYSTPDNKGLLLGILFDANGDSVTSQQLKHAYESDAVLAQAVGANPVLETQAKTAKPSRSEQLWTRLGGLTTVSLGDAAAPAAYVFIDTQCPHCKAFLRMAMASDALKNGTVQLKTIPIAIVNEKSIAQAVTLTNDPKAVAYLTGLIQDDKAVIPGTPQGDMTKLRANLQAFLDYKFDVTPLIVYRGADQKVKLVRGMPTDLPGFLSDIK
ncbi:MAG: thioredoxin domain-containing protein [Pseudomonadota bacterium]